MSFLMSALTGEVFSEARLLGEDEEDEGEKFERRTREAEKEIRKLERRMKKAGML